MMNRVFASLGLGLALALASCAMGEDDELLNEDEVSSQQEEVRGLVVSCDADGDGYLAVSCGGHDCDDNDPEVHPGAISPDPATCHDGVDNNCQDGVDDPAECQDAGCSQPSCNSL